MKLGTPPLSYTDVPSWDLAEEISVRLRRPTTSVVDVVQLRLQALDVARSLNAADLLADQRSWEAVRLGRDGGTVTSEDIDFALLDVLADHGVDEAVRTQLQHLQEATATSLIRHLWAEQPGEHAELSTLARDYLDAALAGRRDDALKIVQEAVATGLEPSQVMLSVLQPAQRELGRLWASGDITVAHEHYVTGLTQVSMSVLYPAVPHQRSPDAPRMVALAVGAEGHELGMRMVSDLMQHEGWNVAYLGADVPAADVASFVAATRPDVLAVSATMAANVLGVRDLIADLRAQPECAGIHVLVGGRPFNANPRLQTMVDADGMATGPREALQLCWLWMQRRASLPAPGS